jgi:Cu(I)/Ag(I) efflux system membrane protein CusA/SilA
MWSHGTGSEVMQRIAAPMIGGMITAPLLSMLVIPAVFQLLRRRRLALLPDTGSTDASATHASTARG